MTNTVLVAASCDVIATGVDFLATTLPITVDVTSVVPNTSAGVLGNPNAGADSGDLTGGALSIPSTGIAAVDTAISSAIGALNVASLPGVYVICTQAPTSFTLVSGASTLNLPTTTAPYTGTFNSKMKGTGGGASASNQISYSLALAGTAVNTTGLPITVFSAAILATGTIPAAGQTGNSIVPGYYADTATATVNF